MTIPKFWDMYRPILDFLADGEEHAVDEMRDVVIQSIGVTEEDLKKLLPSGRQTFFANRFGWARTYLKKAGLIDNPSKAVYKITQAGKELLAEDPPVIDNQLLKRRYESFRLFLSPGSSGEDESDDPGSNEEETPQEQIDNAFKLINSDLADELLSEIFKQTPEFFEYLVVLLLEKMGYGGSVEGAGRVIGRSGDEGIDGIIREDKLGFSLIYIQAKRWNFDNSIGRPEVQKFVGALVGQGAKKGLFITTAKFTKEAIEYAKIQHTANVILVDGRRLAKLLIEHNLGVSTETVYEIKRLDTDFFSD